MPLDALSNHYGSSQPSISLEITKIISLTRETSAIIPKNVTEKGVDLFAKFFNCYLAAPLLTLGHPQGESLTNSMLISVF